MVKPVLPLFCNNYYKLLLNLSKVIKPFWKTSNHFERHQTIFDTTYPLLVFIGVCFGKTKDRHAKISYVVFAFQLWILFNLHILHPRARQKATDLLKGIWLKIDFCVQRTVHVPGMNRCHVIIVEICWFSQNRLVI